MLYNTKRSENMPHIARALKSVFSSTAESRDHVPDSVVRDQVQASLQRRLSSDLIDNASKMYSKVCSHLSNLSRDKSQGELVFITSILAAVILIVIILPACEAFFPGRKIQNETSNVTKSLPSPSSSTTDSLQTIEESEDEDLAMPIEHEAIIELAPQEPVQDIQIVLSQQVPVQDVQDIPNKSVELEQDFEPPSEESPDFACIPEDKVYDADEAGEIVDADEKVVVDADLRGSKDDKHSIVTPVTADKELEAPISSLLTISDVVKPVLVNDYVSVPDIALQKRSSFGKLGKRLSSTRLGLGRKGSSDASISSTSSLRKLSIRGFGKKKSQCV